MKWGLAPVLGGCALSLAVSAAHAAFTLVPILRSGEFNPGTNVPILRVATPWINSVGSISVYTQSTALPTGATYYGRPGDLARVVVEGDPVGGGSFLLSTSLIENPRITPDGRFGTGIIIGGLGVNSTNNLGLYRAPLGSMPQLVARSGFGLPGLTTGTLTTLLDHVFAPRTVEVALAAVIQGETGVTNGVWATRNGVLSEIIKTGTPAPGLPAGTIFTRGENLGLLPDDTLVFNGALQLPGGISSSGVFVEQNGTLRKLIARGDPAPGYPPGHFFSAAGTPRTSENGVAFRASITPPGTTNVTAGLFVTDPAAQTVTAVIKRGDPLANPNEYFGGSECVPSMNDHGAVAFHGFITDSFNNALGVGFFVKDASGIRQIARSGQPAPGAGSTAFSEFSSIAFSINSRGEIAFVAELADETEGIWVVEPDGAITPIAIEGRPFEAAPGDFRIPSAVSAFLLGDSDTGSDALNDRGEFVFSLRFTNNSSAAYLIQLPEPTAAAKGLLLAAATMRRRRR